MELRIEVRELMAEVMKFRQCRNLQIALEGVWGIALRGWYLGLEAICLVLRIDMRCFKCIALGWRKNRLLTKR